METAMDSQEQTIATEAFNPTLADEYEYKYKQLIKKLGSTLPANRIGAIQSEIESLDIKDHIEDLERLKYAASLSVLIDLSQQGWIFDVKEDQLFLRMETDNVDDKKMLRYRLSAERNAQFKVKSVATFIKRMESDKNQNGSMVSIKSLIGNPNSILDRIRNHERVCNPYIQLVTNGKDTYTGYKLSDIWRYFRYTWSIPYKTMPGRNLYYLVRDSLQPYHPVIGIFALGNSVLNLTVRDDDIGWTVDAIKKKMERETTTSFCNQSVSGIKGKTVKVKVTKACETKDEHSKRADLYADNIYPLLLKNISDAINDLYVKDLGYHKQTRYPKPETIENLLEMAAEYAKKSINNLPRSDTHT